MTDIMEDVCTTPGRDASTASVRSRKVGGGAGLLKRGKGMPAQLARFQVDLDGQNRIYFAGDELKGYVHVHLNEDLPVHGIILRIVGEAYVNVADEPRPWTAAKRLGKLKRSFKSKKISPASFSDPSDTAESFFFRDSNDNGGNWETETTTTFVSGPRSQRSTLQRDQPIPEPSVKPKIKFRGKGAEETRFRAHEKYFEHKIYVFGHRYSSTRELMWKGQHSFQFSYTLPSKLPVSFHGRFGYVRYFCEASLERHAHPTVQRRCFFSVSSVMDLNNDSKADSAVSKEKKTNSWCFCCPSGTIIVSAKIRKRGYVPGEMIPIQGYVFNVSNKPVRKITARIIQIATYFSSRGFQKRFDETIVCEKSEGILPPGESTFWDEVGPRVPPCPPSSTMIDCKLITIDYRLEFALDIHKAKEPLILRMPLRVGTVPLEKVFKNLMDQVGALDFGDDRTSFPAAVCAKYPKLPAVFGFKCIKGERNVNRYYFRQIPRSMHSMLGISSRMPQQPTISEDDEMFAPRYLTYMMCPASLKLTEEPERKKSGKSEARKMLQNGNAKQITNHLVIKVSPRSDRKNLPDTNSIISNGPDLTKSYLSNGQDRSLMANGMELPISVISREIENISSNFKQGIASAVINGGDVATTIFSYRADVTDLALSNASSGNTPSALCSPASFRSYKEGKILKKTDLAHRLANMTALENSDGLRKRPNTSLCLYETKLDFSEQNENKKEK